MKEVQVQFVCDFVMDGLKEKSYSKSTIGHYSRTLRQFKEFAKANSQTTYTPELGELFRHYEKGEKTDNICACTRSIRNRCMDLFDGYLANAKLDFYSKRRRGYESPATEAFQVIHKEYLDALSFEGKSQNTIESFRNVTCKYLQHLEQMSITSLVSAPSASIYSFVTELKRTWSEGSLRTALSALRSFLRHAGRESLLSITEGIRPIRKHEILPVLTEEEESMIWSVLKSQSDITRRDKAIVMISLITGLRASDIAALRLDSIDWKSDVISIRQQKTGNLLSIPMIPALGNAIADYVLHERPKENNDALFMNIKAPHRPMKGHSNCYHIIKRVFIKAGIRTDIRICGTRLLRHNVASRMLRNETSIEMISAVLGHVTPDSTEIYLATDEARMRVCCLPLPNMTIEEVDRNEI